MNFFKYILTIVLCFTILCGFSQNTTVQNITPLGFSGDFTELQYGKSVGLIALNNYGVLYTSKDTGRTWEPQLPPLEKAQEIVMYNESLGYIYNENQMYRTTDGCATWQELTMEGLPKVLDNQKITYNKLSLKNEDTLFLAVSNKINGLKLYMSGDKGNTWKMVAKDIMNNWIGGVFFALHFDTPLVGYGYCYGCQIYTEDGGETWTNTKYSNFEDSYLIALKTEKGGVLLHHLNYDTNNSELFWCESGAMKEKKILYENIGGNFISELVYLQQFSDTIIMVDNDYFVYKTFDHGENWFVDSINYLHWKINKAYFFSSRVGILVGRNLTSYVTEDGGETWTKYVHGGGEGFNNIYCKNGNECFITGETGRFFSTNDEGESWNIQDVHDGALYEIEFPTNDVGYVVGPQVLLKTIDGGLTWNKKKLKIVNAQYIDFFNENVGYLGYSSMQPTIHKTVDGGEYWESREGCYNDTYRKNASGMTKFSFRNENEGVVCGTKTLLHTIDGGETWELKECVPENTYPQSILSIGDKGWLLHTNNHLKDYSFDRFFFYDNDFNGTEIFSGTVSDESGNLQKINDSTYKFSYDTLDFISTDEGLTWNPIYTGMKGQRFFVTENLGYSITNNQIYKYCVVPTEIQMVIVKNDTYNYSVTPMYDGNPTTIVLYLIDENNVKHKITDEIKISNGMPVTIGIPASLPLGSYTLYVEAQDKNYLSTNVGIIVLEKSNAITGGQVQSPIYRVNGKTLYIYDSNAKLYSALGIEIPVQHGYIELKTGVYILVNGNETYKIVIQ